MFIVDLFKFDGDRLRQPGVSYGDSDLHLIEIKGQYAVVKQAGSQGWACLGSRNIIQQNGIL